MPHLLQLESDPLLSQFPWLKDLLIALLALALVALLVYLARPAARGSSADFTIHVDDEDITFQGAFPPGSQALVIDFLRDDCQIPGPYRIRGTWSNQTLQITVEGPNAQPHAQRIRNFLKLNIKAPGKK